MEKSTKRLVIAFCGVVVLLAITAALLSYARSSLTEARQSKGGDEMLSGLRNLSNLLTNLTDGVVFEQPISESVPAKTEVEIDISHSHGNITVKGWDEDEVKLEGRKIVKARDEETARMYAEQMKVEIKSEDDKIIVRTIRPERDMQWKVTQITINYELYAPKRLNITMENTHGDVAVEGFMGSLKLDGRHGNLQVSQIGKDAVINHEHGNIVLSEIGGSVTVTKKHGEVKVESVDGDLKMEHEHGDVDLAMIGKGVELKKQHGKLSVANINGPLKIAHEHGVIYLKQIEGNVELSKQHGNIDIDMVKGNVSTQSDHGNLRIINIEGNVYVRGSHGNAHVENISGSADVMRAHSKVTLNNIKGAVAH